MNKSAMYPNAPQKPGITTPVAFFVRVVSGLYARFHRHVLDYGYDRRFGLATGGIHWPEDLHPQQGAVLGANEYEAAPVLVLQRLFQMDVGDPKRLTFIDMGCGKGRALIAAAATLPFKRVEGVELSRELADVARANAAAAAPHLKSEVLVHQMNATYYTFPSGPFILFLFNPFHEEILQRVVTQLEAELKREPREVFIYYLNPKHRNVLDSCPTFREMPRTMWQRLLDRVFAPWAMAFYTTHPAK